VKDFVGVISELGDNVVQVKVVIVLGDWFGILRQGGVVLLSSLVSAFFRAMKLVSLSRWLAILNGIFFRRAVSRLGVPVSGGARIQSRCASLDSTASFY
jgi:hypothetical protein